MIRLIFTLILLFVTTVANARLIREDFQGVRAMGMGNAFIALADDANLLWSNPAGLAKVRGVKVNLLDFTLGADSLVTLNQVSRALTEVDPIS